MPLSFNNTNVNTISFNGSNIARATFNGDQFFLNIPPTTKACEYKREGMPYQHHLYVGGVNINPTMGQSSGTAYIDSSGNISLTSGSDKRAFSFDYSFSHVLINTYKEGTVTYEVYRNTIVITIAGVSRTFTKDVTVRYGSMGGDPNNIDNQSWSQLV